MRSSRPVQLLSVVTFFVGSVVPAALAQRPSLSEVETELSSQAAALTALDAQVSALGQREVVFAVSPTDSAQTKTVDATCPSGKVAVGGGGRITFAPGGGSVGQALTASHPLDAMTWRVVAGTSNNPQGDWTLTGYAVCVVL